MFDFCPKLANKNLDFCQNAINKNLDFLSDMYFNRLIDNELLRWKNDSEHKPLLLRGARQVGKSRAVKHLGESFRYYIEINFEKQPVYKQLFASDLDVHRITSQIAALSGIPVVEGQTLLFFDEIQECTEAIMSLRFFREDMPALHVVAAGSLLEFVLQEIPTFGVGRIHSMYMHPMTFDEFLTANGMTALLEQRLSATVEAPLSQPLHDKLVEYLRTYLLVGGMPEAVAQWVEMHDYLRCQRVQDDILVTYEDDFAKYAKRVNPNLLRLTLRSVALQVGNKFVYSRVSTDYKASAVRQALDLLVLAGIAIPVTRTSANGVPLGSEADSSCRKMLLLDTGLMLRLQHMSLGNSTEMSALIMTATAEELVNKGSITEMLVGLELLRYRTMHMRHELYYWAREERGSTAEVDYEDVRNGHVLPIEVKAAGKGGMKSLWLMMREKHLDYALRISLENFGQLEYTDAQAADAVRHVEIYPLYALAQIR